MIEGPGDEVQPIVGEVMTDAEVDALLDMERQQVPAGSVANTYVCDTPSGQVYLKAKNLDEAMIIADALADAGYPRRIDPTP